MKEIIVNVYVEKDKGELSCSPSFFIPLQPDYQ